MKRQRSPLPASRIGLTLMLLGAAVLAIGQVHQHGLTWSGLFDDLYANFGSELVGMAMVILLIDRFAARREDERVRRQLVRELASTDRGLTTRAALELEAKGWLTDGTLQGAQLSGANLSGVRLERAQLSDAALAGATMASCNLSGARLTRANLADANLDRANLEMADLAGAALPQATLTDADAGLANFVHADLSGAKLAGTDLTGANLTGSDLCGTDLTRAVLTRTILTAVRWDAHTRWPTGFEPAVTDSPDEE